MPTAGSRIGHRRAVEAWLKQTGEEQRVADKWMAKYRSKLVYLNRSRLTYLKALSFGLVGHGMLACQRS